MIGLEMVALTKRQELELDLAELKMFGFSLGMIRTNRIRHEYIRGTRQIGCFEGVRDARLRSFGHV